jgi:hypothetical protein
VDVSQKTLAFQAARRSGRRQDWECNISPAFACIGNAKELSEKAINFTVVTFDPRVDAASVGKEYIKEFFLR